MRPLSIAIVDTYPNKGFAKIAINMALRLQNVCKVYTFSDEEYFPGAEFVRVPKINSNNQYGKVIFDIFPKVISEEFFLVIQWDGFPLVPEHWSDEYFKYDYIGAPLQGGPEKIWVGNGGFSFRSQRLLQALAGKNITIDKDSSIDQPEDEIICMHKRQVLESIGIKFPSFELASQFSYQAVGKPPDNLFGFHGAHNLPIFISEQQLIPHADEIIERLSQPLNLLMYLQNCHNSGMHDLVAKSVSSFSEKPNLIGALEYANLHMPFLGFGKLIERFN